MEGDRKTTILERERQCLLHPNEDRRLYSSDLLQDSNNNPGVARDKYDLASASHLSDAGDSRMCRRRPWVEIPVFIYFFAYRACLPLKEQFVFAVVSGQYLPPEDDYLIDPDTTRSACGGDTNVSGDAANFTRLYDALDRKIEQVSSEWLSYMNLARNVPGLVLTLLICSLTDARGRRFGLTLPCIGGALKSLFFVVIILFRLPLWTVIVAEVLEGVCGSIMTTQSVAYAYLVDTVDKADKTFRFSIIHALYYLGTAFGNVLTGFVIRDCGYLFSFVIFTAIFIVDIFIIWIVIYESKPNSSNASPISIKKTFYDAISSLGVFVWRPRKIIEAKVPDKVFVAEPIVTKKTILILWLLLVAFFGDSLVLQGRNDVDVLFTLAKPFCWSSMTIGYFQCAKFVGKALAATFLLRLLHQCVGDHVIGIIAATSGVVGNVIMGLAETPFTLWMSTWPGMFSGLVTPISSSLMSRLLPSQQQSALFASLGVLEGLGDLASATVLDIIYSITVSFLPGTVFLIISFVYFLAGLSFLLTACLE